MSLAPSSRLPGPAAWPAAVGAAIVIYWADRTLLLPLWATLPFALAYPLFVFTAERRRCRELLGGLDAALQFGLGLGAAALWALLPALASTRLFDASLSIYTYLPSDKLLQLLLVAFVFVPLLFGLVFRYIELWLGSAWALFAVTALYVADGFYPAREMSLVALAWPLLTALVYALSYLLTRRLWLPIALRIGEALFFTTAPIFTLDIVHVRVLSSRDYDELLHLGLVAVAALVLGAVAWRRGAIVSRRDAWTAQTGLPFPETEDLANHVGDAGLWATLGCAFLLSRLDSFAGRSVLWLCLVPLTYWAFVRFAERRRCEELRGGLVGFAQGAGGLAWGAVLALVPLGVAALLSGTALEGTSLAPRTLTLIFLFALSEELVWRGLLLRILEARIGSGLALAATAIGFAAWHLTGDPFYLLQLAAAGAMLGAAYLCTRRLWLAVGLHFGWNLVVGATESGYYGLLGFAAVLVLELLTVVAFVLVAQRRGRLLPAPWAKRRRSVEVETALPPSGASSEIASSWR